MSKICDRVALIKKANEILKDVTPLSQVDCGQLCGKACCGGGENIGMELLPNEELLLKGTEGFQIVSDEGRKILLCGGVCNRDTRPFACRIFPIVPVWEQGHLQLIFDPGATSLCPLKGQDDYLRDFRKSVARAVGLLSADPVLHDWFLEKSIFLTEMKKLVKRLK